MDPIPLIREQIYQVSPVSFFRVAGILPDGNVSGRFFKSDPDTKGKAVTRLVVDEAVPSDGRDEMRGSGFTTSLPVSHFLTAPGPGGGSRRVITSKGSYYWKVHAFLPFRPVDPPRDLPVSPLIPTLPDRLQDVVSYLEENNVDPTHMSSDAGLDHFTGPTSSVFQVGPKLAGRSSACVIVADATFSPLKRPPAVAIVIEGMKRILHLNSFISELIGGLAMSFVRGRYEFPILANMDCKSVTDMQASQPYLLPAEAQAQGKVYNQVLRVFHQVRGSQPPIVHGESHPERPRPPKKNSPSRRAIPEAQWTHSNWLNHLADRYASGSGATAGLATRNLEPTKVFTFQVEDILNSAVPPDSLFWRYDLSMPLVNGVGSPLSLRKGAEAYLAQRDSKALSRAAAT
jgi:hypothetical protein